MALVLSSSYPLPPPFTSPSKAGAQSCGFQLIFQPAPSYRRIKFPNPTPEQRRAVVQKVFELIIQDPFEVATKVALSDFTRKGSCLFDVHFNGKHDDPAFKGFTVTAELVQDVVDGLTFFFPNVEFTNLDRLTLPYDNARLAFKLCLCPSRPMPVLGSTATVAERALYDYIQTVTRYYVGREGVDTASLQAVGHILQRLYLDELSSGETTYLAKNFLFNTKKSIKELSMEAITDGSEPLERLYIEHQIPTIKTLLERAFHNRGFTYSVNVEILSGKGEYVDPGVFKISVSAPPKPSPSLSTSPSKLENTPPQTLSLTSRPAKALMSSSEKTPVRFPEELKPASSSPAPSPYSSYPASSSPVSDARSASPSVSSTGVKPASSLFSNLNTSEIFSDPSLTVSGRKKIGDMSPGELLEIFQNPQAHPIQNANGELHGLASLMRTAAVQKYARENHLTIVEYTDEEMDEIRDIFRNVFIPHLNNAVIRYRNERKLPSAYSSYPASSSPVSDAGSASPSVSSPGASANFLSSLDEHLKYQGIVDFDEGIAHFYSQSGADRFKEKLDDGTISSRVPEGVDPEVYRRFVDRVRKKQITVTVMNDSERGLFKIHEIKLRQLLHSTS